MPIASAGAAIPPSPDRGATPLDGIAAGPSNGALTGSIAAGGLVERALLGVAREAKGCASDPRASRPELERSKASMLLVEPERPDRSEEPKLEVDEPVVPRPDRPAGAEKLGNDAPVVPNPVRPAGIEKLGSDAPVPLPSPLRPEPEPRELKPPKPLVPLGVAIPDRPAN